jgi:septal ring factor EnvC (AmiA/AmiB activator)
MPSTLPRSVRESWGEQAADDFAGWLDDRIRERAVHRDDFREVLSRLDVLENEVAGIDDRLDRFETRFDQIDQRFDQQSAQFDQRLDQQSVQFDQRLDKMNERFDRLHEQMRVQTRWTVGTIALFGTIVTVLLAIAQFGGG